jgi:hypothetical protein
MSLIALLRNNQCRVVYNQNFDPSWSDDQLLSHVIELDCAYKKLTILPELPNCQYLYCYRNQLTTLPDLPNCQELDCSDNQLTTLSNLPNCEWLSCFKNQLTTLPDLPNCRFLYCFANLLTTLPDLPNCIELYRQDNPLLFDQVEQWKIIWKARRLYLQLKYFRLWYLRMLQSKAEKRQTLHLELLWSPDTKFYQATEEYRHFIESSQPSKN